MALGSSGKIGDKESPVTERIHVLERIEGLIPEALSKVAPELKGERDRPSGCQVPVRGFGVTPIQVV